MSIAMHRLTDSTEAMRSRCSTTSTAGTPPAAGWTSSTRSAPASRRVHPRSTRSTGCGSRSAPVCALALRPAEQSPELLGDPSGRRLSGGRFVESLDHHEAVELAAAEGGEECVIILERQAAVRLAVRPEHVGMRQNAVAAVHLGIVRRIETDRVDAMEASLAHGEVVDARRCRTEVAQVDGAEVVHVLAEAGMRLEAPPAREIDRVPGDVVDR